MSMVLLIAQVVPLPQLRLSHTLFEDFVVVQAPSPYLLLTAGRSLQVVEVSRLGGPLIVTTLDVKSSALSVAIDGSDACER